MLDLKKRIPVSELSSVWIDVGSLHRCSPFRRAVGRFTKDTVEAMISQGNAAEHIGQVG